MDLEELAFKNITEISELPREILLHIIVILQQDRKCWIEQYTRGHNDFIDVQTRNDKAIKDIETFKDEIKKYQEQDKINHQNISISLVGIRLNTFLKDLKGSDK